MKSAKQEIWDAARARSQFTVSELRAATYQHRHAVVEYLLRWTAAGYLQAHEDTPDTYSWRRAAPQIAPLVTHGGKILKGGTGLNRVMHALRVLGTPTVDEVAATAEVTPRTAGHYLRLMVNKGLACRETAPSLWRPARFRWLHPEPVTLVASETRGLLVTPLREARRG